jgi:hypothetical protein
MEENWKDDLASEAYMHKDADIIVTTLALGLFTPVVEVYVRPAPWSLDTLLTSMYGTTIVHIRARGEDCGYSSIEPNEKMIIWGLGPELGPKLPSHDC